jgi:hypothetical protein
MDAKVQGGNEAVRVLNRMVIMKRVAQTTSVLIFVFGFGASSLEAANGIGFVGWGLRGGASIDPDQVHVGLHIDAGRFAPKVRFQPSFEVGFGNDRIVGAINLDAFYVFRARGWNPYLGGGLGVALIDFDRDRSGGDDFKVEAGLNLIGGFEWGRNPRYLLEVRAGVGDIPELKVTAGVTF